MNPAPGPGWLAFGFGGFFPGGNAESGVPISQVFGPMVNFGFEGGLRLNPHIGLGLYLDWATGSPGSDVQAFCNNPGRGTGSAFPSIYCNASSFRYGVLARYTVFPFAHTTPWFSLGTGGVSDEVSTPDFNGFSSTVAKYTGWQIARLQAGWDIRSNHVFGFGLYAGVGFTRYNAFANSVGSQPISPTVHTTAEVGVRFTLFP
jgi:hypothetical protein